MRVRRVTTLREFDALAPLWREVTQEAGQESPFLSHDWFACCWRTAGVHRRREVWLVEDAAGPVAFVPLARWKAKVHGLPAQVVGFLDAPDTPFVDFAIGRGREEVIATFLDQLHAHRDWDVLTIPKLPADSRTFKAMEVALPANFRWRVASRELSPYITIDRTWESFYRGRTQRFRKTCRNIENRLERRGTLTVEEHRRVHPADDTFADAMQVSLRSWKAPRARSMATMEGMPRFFQELTERASANGWLHLWILRLDGRAIATEYHVGANGTLHALRADYDSTLSELSPGAYLNIHIVRELFERGDVQEYDMGPGANEYKLRWATGAHETLTLDVYAPTAYGRLLHAIQTRVVPLARRWRDRLSEQSA